MVYNEENTAFSENLNFLYIHVQVISKDIENAIVMFKRIIHSQMVYKVTLASLSCNYKSLGSLTDIKLHIT